MVKKVYLGVGHGGKDSGAAANGYKEKIFNLDTAKACRDELVRHGVNVMLSRESDLNENLSARIRECNAFSPDLAVDIHYNAGGGDGAEVYHGKNDKTDDALAKNILDEIVKIGQNSRGMKTRTTSNGADYFGFVRQINCPSVLVECAFLDNKKDVQIVDTLTERKTMGIAIALGIIKTLGIEYIKPEKNNGFLPERGYFTFGDRGEKIEKINDFFYRVFPSYAKTLGRNKENLPGAYFGENTRAWVKEFQTRTKLEQDGNIGPVTLAQMQKYGFKI